MKVIHYITDITNAAGPIAGSVRMMLACTGKMTECHLITCVPLQEAFVNGMKEQYGVTIHVIKPVKGRNPLEFRAFESRIKKVMKEAKPDVMHVHGAWDFMAAMAEWKARHENVVTVVSPHRGLSTEIINIDFWNKKLIRLLAYQIWMVRNCTMVVAINEKERENIMSLGLKKRIEVMPQLPKEIEGAGMLRDAMVAAYRKALDSTYFRRITKAEQDFVIKAARAAVIDTDVEQIKPSTEGVSFRNIFLYAYDEDATELMLQGGQKLGLILPPTLNVETVPRYVNRNAKKRGSINGITLSSKIKLGDNEKIERVAVEQIAKSHSIGMKRMTQRNFVELYQLFRHTDFNEDIVAAELKRLGLKSYTKKLQKRLHEMFGLKAGYNIF